MSAFPRREPRSILEGNVCGARDSQVVGRGASPTTLGPGSSGTATDARGITTLYDYGADPLGRLQRVTYRTSGFCDLNNPIVPTPPTRSTMSPLATCAVRGVSRLPGS